MLQAGENRCGESQVGVAKLGFYLNKDPLTQIWKMQQNEKLPQGVGGNLCWGVKT